MAETAIWAHRGSSHKYIENTMPAFEQAVKDGADGIEIDVQRTKDGKLIVFHDENLKRLAGVDKFIWDMTYQDLEEIELNVLGQKGKIPLLEEVLDLVKKNSLLLNIELKNNLNFYPGMEEEVLSLIQEKDMLDQILFSSFNHVSMRKMSELTAPEYCAILTADIQVEPWNYAKEAGAKSLHPMLNSIQQENYVKGAQERGLNVNVWTADTDIYINAALLADVDAIITNEPEKALKLRQEFRADGGKSARDMVEKVDILIGK